MKSHNLRRMVFFGIFALIASVTGLSILLSGNIGLHILPSAVSALTGYAAMALVYIRDRRIRRKEEWFRQHGVPVTGRVTGLEILYWDRTSFSFRYPRRIYADYEYAGGEYDTARVKYHGQTEYGKGDVITVRVDPDRPEHCMILPEDIIK